MGCILDVVLLLVKTRQSEENVQTNEFGMERSTFTLRYLMGTSLVEMVY